MADVKAEVGIGQGGEVVLSGPEPEIVPTESTQGRGVDKAALLQEMAEEFMRKNFRPVLECVLTNVLEHKHLPSARLLVELAKMVVTEGEAPVEAYESVTEVIWKSYQKVQRKQ